MSGKSIVFLAVALLAAACLGAENTGTASFEGGKLELATKGMAIEGLTEKAASFTDGVSGQALRLEKASLSYPSSGSININKGTISFWIRPVDWGDAETDFLPIIALDGGLGKSWQLLMYYVNNSRSGRLLDFRMRMDAKREVIAQLSAAKFKQGEWNHIALSWTDMEMKFNLNGEKGATQSYGLPIKRNTPEKHRVWFMPDNFWRKKNTFTTDLDEIKFFDGFLTDSEVKQLYLAHSGKGSATTSEASIPRASAPVKLDGMLDKGEWDDASRLPVSVSLESKTVYSRNQAWAMLKNDGRNLLLAFEIEGRITENDATPNTRTHVYKHATLAEMDLVSSSGKTLQYFVYPNGAWAKKTGPQSNWDEDTQMKSAVHATKNGWTAEISIPLSELEANSKTLTANLGLRREDLDINVDNDRWLAWNTAGKGNNFLALAGKLTLDAPAVRIESLGDLENGNVNYSASKGLTLKARDLVEGTSRSYEGQGKDKLPWAGMTGIEISGDGMNWAANVLIREIASLKTTCHGNARILDFEIALKEGDHKLEKALRSGKLLAKISLADEQGKAIASKETCLESLKTLLKLPFPKLETGYYLLNLEIKGEDIDFSINRKFGVPEMDFIGTQEGLEKTIPLPWSKPVRKDDAVFTNFHEYRFKGKVFPAKAWSFRQPVLQDSSDFQITIDGKQASFKQAVKEEYSDTFEALSSTGKLKSTDGKVLLSWKRVIDFDGLVRVDFSIEPAGRPVLLENFWIEFTIPDESAKIAMTPNMDVSWEKRGATVKSPYLIWATGKRGFAVFTDNNANYVFPKNGHPFMIYRHADGTAKIRASFITGRSRLEKKAEYTLALMATPGKPPRADWRKLHGEGWLAYKGQNMAVRGWSHEKKEIGFYRSDYLAWPADPASTLKLIEEYRKLGIDCIPYCTNNMIPDANPLYDYFAKDWERAYHGEASVSVPGTDFDGTKYHLFVPVCQNVPQYRDYLCYYTARNMDKFGYKGIYLDSGGTTTTNRPYNLIERERVLTPERPVEIMNIFGTRELYKRLYKLIKKRYDKGYLYAHNWRGFHPAFMSFVDMVNPGEEFMHSFPVNCNVYMSDKDFSSPGLWQYNYSSEAMGAAVQFLATFNFHPRLKEWFIKRGRNNKEVQAEMFEAGKAMIGMCLLHDVQMSGAGYPPIEGLWATLDQLDISSGTFHPYWEQTELKTDNKDVKVSYYDWKALPQKLIVLANLENKPATVKLTGTNARLVEAWPGSEAFDAASIQIDGYSFRLLKAK